MTPRRGRLITIEGIDGVGKSTLAQSLRELLSRRGLEVRLLREPGGVQAAERIRSLVKDPELGLGPRAEALLYAAARAQLVQEALVPALQAGSWVLLDRFVDSSRAYQGAGRKLGVETVQAINDFATGGLTPDRTLLLALSVGAARQRAAERGQPPDRLEQEGEAFYDRVAAEYARLARDEPQRVRVIDAGAEPEAVLRAAEAEISDLF